MRLTFFMYRFIIYTFVSLGCTAHSGFVPGTQVATPDGEVSIECLTQNQSIYVAKQRNKHSTSTLQDHRCAYHHILVYARIDDIDVYMSCDQLLYDTNKQRWVRADHIQPYDRLMTQAEDVIVHNAQKVPYAGPVWHPMIRDTHTYYATQRHLIAHNISFEITLAVYYFGSGLAFLPGVTIGGLAAAGAFLVGTHLFCRECRRAGVPVEENVHARIGDPDATQTSDYQPPLLDDISESDDNSEPLPLPHNSPLPQEHQADATGANSSRDTTACASTGENTCNSYASPATPKAHQSSYVPHTSDRNTLNNKNGLIIISHADPVSPSYTRQDNLPYLRLSQDSFAHSSPRIGLLEDAECHAFTYGSISDLESEQFRDTRDTQAIDVALHNNLTHSEQRWYITCTLTTNNEYDTNRIRQIYADNETYTKLCRYIQNRKPQSCLDDERYIYIHCGTRQNDQRRQREIEQYGAALDDCIEVWSEEASEFLSPIYHRRIDAAQALQQDNTVFEERYELAPETEEIIHAYGFGGATFHTCYGNVLQHTLHQEYTTMLNHLAEILSSYTHVSYLNDLHSLAVRLLEIGEQYNALGDIVSASDIADACWYLIKCDRDIIFALWNGSVEGCDRFITMICYPRETLIDLGRTFKWLAENIIEISVDSYTLAMTQNQKEYDTTLEAMHDRIAAASMVFAHIRDNITLYNVTYETTALLTEMFLQHQMTRAASAFFEGMEQQGKKLLKKCAYYEEKALLQTPEGATFEAADEALESGSGNRTCFFRRSNKKAKKSSRSGRKPRGDKTGCLEKAPHRNEVTSVRNMKEFFENTKFGQELKQYVRKTSKQKHGQTVYEVTEKLPEYGLKEGDQLYLDGLHKDHLEIFKKNGKAKDVLNLSGSRNLEKAKEARKANRNI